MRKVFSVALMAAMVCLVGMTRDAGATVTISLVFTSCSGGTGCVSGVGTNALTVNPGGGQTIEMDVILTHNEATGLGGHFFSVNFDSDLGNELDLLVAKAWGGFTYMVTMASATYSPLGAGVGPNTESTGAVGGQIGTYESGTTATQGLPAGTYTVGTARFLVTSNVTLDGDDLFSGLFRAGFDTIANGANQPTVNIFGTGSVSAIPEPGTASLLGLGIVGLVLAGRRSRRS
jgi:hypothetical protein